MDKAERAEKAKPQRQDHHKHYNPQLSEIIQQLKTTNKYLKRIMTAEEKAAEYAATIASETTRIAELLQGLANDGDLNLEELQAALQGPIDQLKAVGVPPTP